MCSVSMCTFVPVKQVKVHWLWVIVLMEERVIVILDPLTSHTGKEGHREIVKKIWHWREAIVAKDDVPRTPPPMVDSLEEGTT